VCPLRLQPLTNVMGNKENASSQGFFFEHSVLPVLTPRMVTYDLYQIYLASLSRINYTNNVLINPS